MTFQSQTIHESRATSTLQLYDGVFDTLKEFNHNGVRVVAYTDARIHNSVYRMSKLGLIPIISSLYSPLHLIETQHPGPLPEYTSSIPTSYVHDLPATDRKPNPRALLDICADFGVVASDALYVGDSLVRDVYMAQKAGLHNAWARYGTKSDPALWKQLVRVTHWTDEDVAREEQVRTLAGEVTPETTLDSFTDILDLYSFAPAQIPE